ncbi:hypothetical protein VCCP1035_1725B, partial [Vibrio cholerae CP1035(8)]
FTNRVLIWEQ